MSVRAERRVRPAGQEGRRAPSGATPGRGGAGRPSGSRGTATAGRTSSPAASGSASRWPGPWSNRPEGAAARRAARRPRPQAAPRDAGRAQADPARRRHHLRVRHPRPGGGAHDERPDRGLQRRAASSRSATPVELYEQPASAVRRRLRRHLEPARGRRRPQRCSATPGRFAIRPEKIAMLAPATRRPADGDLRWPAAWSREVVYLGAATHSSSSSTPAPPLTVLAAEPRRAPSTPAARAPRASRSRCAGSATHVVALGTPTTVSTGQHRRHRGGDTMNSRTAQRIGVGQRSAAGAGSPRAAPTRAAASSRRRRRRASPPPDVPMKESLGHEEGAGQHPRLAGLRRGRLQRPDGRLGARRSRRRPAARRT